MLANHGDASWHIEPMQDDIPVRESVVDHVVAIVAIVTVVAPQA